MNNKDFWRFSGQPVRCEPTPFHRASWWLSRIPWSRRGHLYSTAWGPAGQGQLCTSTSLQNDLKLLNNRLKYEWHCLPTGHCGGPLIAFSRAQDCSFRCEVGSCSSLHIWASLLAFCQMFHHLYLGASLRYESLQLQTNLMTAQVLISLWL